MILPSSIECIAKIRFNSMVAVQKIRLDDYPFIINSAPKQTEVQILSYKDDKVAWKPIKTIKLDYKHKLKCDLVLVKKTDFKFIKPLGVEFEIASAIPEIFEKSGITYGSYVMGLLANQNVQTGYVKFDSPKKITLKSFILNKTTMLRRNPHLILNGREFDFIGHYDTINETIMDYIALMQEYIADVYLTERYIEKDYLTPLIFSKLFDITNITTSNDLIVPYSMHWMMQMMYGSTHNVVSKLQYRRGFVDFSLKDAEFNVKNWPLKFNKLQLELEDEYQPYLINNSIPVKYKGYT